MDSNCSSLGGGRGAPKREKRGLKRAVARLGMLTAVPRPRISGVAAAPGPRGGDRAATVTGVAPP